MKQLKSMKNVITMIGKVIDNPDIFNHDGVQVGQFHITQPYGKELIAFYGSKICKKVKEEIKKGDIIECYGVSHSTLNSKGNWQVIMEMKKFKLIG